MLILFQAGDSIREVGNAINNVTQSPWENVLSSYPQTVMDLGYAIATGIVCIAFFLSMYYFQQRWIQKLFEKRFDRLINVLEQTCKDINKLDIKLEALKEEQGGELIEREKICDNLLKLTSIMQQQQTTTTSLFDLIGSALQRAMNGKYSRIEGDNNGSKK